MNRLRELRVQRGLALCDLSIILKNLYDVDITPDVLREYERQEREMNYKMLNIFSCFYHESIDYLLGNIKLPCVDEEENPMMIFCGFDYCPYCGRKL